MNTEWLLALSVVGDRTMGEVNSVSYIRRIKSPREINKTVYYGGKNMQKERMGAVFGFLMTTLFVGVVMLLEHMTLTSSLSWWEVAVNTTFNLVVATAILGMFDCREGMLDWVRKWLL